MGFSVDGILVEGCSVVEELSSTSCTVLGIPFEISTVLGIQFEISTKVYRNID